MGAVGEAQPPHCAAGVMFEVVGNQLFNVAVPVAAGFERGTLRHGAKPVKEIFGKEEVNCLPGVGCCQTFQLRCPVFKDGIETRQDGIETRAPGRSPADLGFNFTVPLAHAFRRLRAHWRYRRAETPQP